MLNEQQLSRFIKEPHIIKLISGVNNVATQTKLLSAYIDVMPIELIYDLLSKLDAPRTWRNFFINKFSPFLLQNKIKDWLLATQNFSDEDFLKFKLLFEIFMSKETFFTDNLAVITHLTKYIGADPIRYVDVRSLIPANGKEILNQLHRAFEVEFKKIVDTPFKLGESLHKYSWQSSCNEFLTTRASHIKEQFKTTNNATELLFQTLAHRQSNNSLAFFYDQLLQDGEIKTAVAKFLRSDSRFVGFLIEGKTSLNQCVIKEMESSEIVRLLVNHLNPVAAFLNIIINIPRENILSILNKLDFSSHLLNAKNTDGILFIHHLFRLPDESKLNICSLLQNSHKSVDGVVASLLYIQTLPDMKGGEFGRIFYTAFVAIDNNKDLVTTMIYAIKHRFATKPFFEREKTNIYLALLERVSHYTRTFSSAPTQTLIASIPEPWRKNCVQQLLNKNIEVFCQELANNYPANAILKGEDLLLRLKIFDQYECKDKIRIFFGKLKLHHQQQWLHMLRIRPNFPYDCNNLTFSPIQPKPILPPSQPAPVRPIMTNAQVALVLNPIIAPTRVPLQLPMHVLSAEEYRQRRYARFENNPKLRQADQELDDFIESLNSRDSSAAQNPEDANHSMIISHEEKEKTPKRKAETTLVKKLFDGKRLNTTPHSEECSESERIHHGL